MLRIEMFPAREGDCLIITWGAADAPRRILVDGGRKATYADLKTHLDTLPDGQREFELLIITHVDRDHIEGILELLSDVACPVSFKDIWFNGFHHLTEFEDFGAVQGEKLTEQLVARVHTGTSQWNRAFGPGYRKAVVLNADGSRPSVTLDGSMTLTLLSPDHDKLRKLHPRWEKECRAAGLVAGAPAEAPAPEGFEAFAGIDIEALANEPFKRDPSEPNGSSIAVLAEHAGKRILLAGDAHTDLLEQSLHDLAGGVGPVTLDAFKIPHHASRKNVSRELLEAVRCPNWLISTNGSYFSHPDPVAMSRLIKFAAGEKRVWFNYRSEQSQLWDVPSWRQDYHYEPKYPEPGADGYQVIDLA